MPSDRFYHDRRSSGDSSSLESPSTSTECTPISSPPITFSPSSSSSPKLPEQTAQAMPSATNSSKKRKFHTDFEQTLHRMATPLTALVNIETGQPHPDFPRNHLSFYLLTSDQLDNLARHHHQVWPAQPATSCYPFRMRSWIGAPDESYVDTDTKRQRFGYFIGMFGYGGPVNAGLQTMSSISSEHKMSTGPNSTIDGHEDCYRYEEDDMKAEQVDCDYEMSENEEICVAGDEVLEWMAREWEAALREARDQSQGPFRKY